MDRYFHAGQCPLCRQGLLYLVRNLADNTVYAHCGECEQGFDTPADIEDKTGYLTLDQDFEAEMATEEDAKRSVWANYALHTVEKHHI